MGFERFLEKCRNYEKNKKKIIKKNIENFGEIIFQKPKADDIIEFMDIAEMSDNIDVKIFAKVASKFIYKCCADLRAKEVRESEEFKKLDPNEIALELFGVTNTIELASDLFTEFDGTQEKEKVADKVKNSLDSVENMEKATGSLTILPKDTN